jgi:catalase
MEPAEAVDAINDLFGRHPHSRALHAKGSWLRGTFTATPRARELCRAAHLQGDPVPVLARLSNGGGHPRVPDTAPEVRGLAVSFELPDGTRTDLVSQSVPRFFSRTPEDFIDFIRASTGRAAAYKLPLYLATHPRALRAAPANTLALRPPVSYATCRYYGVHAFAWLDADGGRRFVRCDWRPLAGEQRLNPLQLRGRGRDFLQEELAARLQREPVRFSLDVQLADPDDDVDDPSVHWPPERPRVDAGELVLTEVVEDPERDGRVVVFDPMRLTGGIEPSQDPVLRFRPRAYSESVRRRSA